MEGDSPALAARGDVLVALVDLEGDTGLEGVSNNQIEQGEDRRWQVNTRVSYGLRFLEVDDWVSTFLSP